MLGVRAARLPPMGWLVLLIGGMTLVRVAVAGQTPLIHEEAYYWLWSRRPDWGYLDHPPLIAYLIALGRLGGDGALWVRLPALLIGAAASYALFLLGRDLFDPRVGLLAAVLFQVTPILSAAGLMSNPDAPMILAWTLALRFAWQGLHGRPSRWGAAGLALGVALLSKLYALVLGAGLGLYLVTSARAWLRRPEPYRAGALALAGLLPVLYWNATHGWASVRFFLSGRSEPGTPPGLEAYVHFATQHLSLVLMLLPAFVWAFWAAGRRRADPRFAFLFWTALPAVLVPLLLAPGGAVGAHWPAPAYIGMAVVLAALWNRAVAVLAVGNTLLLILFLGTLFVPALPPPPGAREYYGWQEAGRRVRQEIQAMGGGVVVATRFPIVAQLGYHTRDTIPLLILPSADPASIWPPVARYAGTRAVAVTYAPDRFAWEGCFERVEEQPPLAITLKGRKIQDFRIFRLYGLRSDCGG